MMTYEEKVRSAIDRIKTYEPQEGYWLAFSGGKDSMCVKGLCDMAGVKYEAHYSLTSVDPPELVKFIKSMPDVSIDVPRYPNGKQKTMWSLIEDNMYPPTRLARYCCRELKESAGDGRITITGVRWAESNNRKNNQGVATIASKKAAKEFSGISSFSQTTRGGIILTNDNDESRRLIEQCYKRYRTTLNPIIDWEDDDVWRFIKSNNIPYCGLYDEGQERIGCIGCPMADRQRSKQFARWPTYKKAYMTAFKKMVDKRNKAGKASDASFADAESVYHWWMQDGVLPGQMDMFGDIEDGDDYGL